MVVKLVNESIYYIKGSERYDGTAKFLTKRGTYIKCHYSQAPELTEEEARSSLKLLNSRMPHPARVGVYIA